MKSELGKKSFLVDLSKSLTDREVESLLGLCRGIVLQRDVVDRLRTFLDLVEAMENEGKLDAPMKDWQILTDLLRQIKREDLVKKLKRFSTKYYKCFQKDETKPRLAFVPIYPDGNDVKDSSKNDRNSEITEDSVTLAERLLCGEYSDFYKGYHMTTTPVFVEVYMPKRQSRDLGQYTTKQGQIQDGLKHKNIVEVLKIFQDKEKFWIVLEWMTDGDLLSYIRSENGQKLTNFQLVKFAAQIAEGMSYMHETKSFVHCNLMACNVFLTENSVIKIAGFALARKLYGKMCELEEDVRLPIEWSALEVLLYRQYYKKSDVWSFGIVLTEIFSRGSVPYRDLHRDQILESLRRGNRPSKPAKCLDTIGTLMDACWKIPQDTRPSFAELVNELKNAKETNPYSESPRRSITKSINSAAAVYLIPNQNDIRRKVDEPQGEDRYLTIIEQNPDTWSISSPSSSGDTLKRIGLERKSSLYPPNQWLKDVEIPRESIEMLEQIGSGEFGEVWKAKLSNGEMVAVKTFFPESMTSRKFLEEAEVMKRLTHEHLVPLVGVCTATSPIYIVSELLTFGSLLIYLRQDAGVSLNLHDLLQYAVQVADAMSYIEAEKFIHRDIAARNVFMHDRCAVKLGDFGLSREIISTYYQAQRDVRFPARWTAPEVTQHQKFSIKSDVWSFGIFLVELVTYGETPYPEMNNYEVICNVNQGYKHRQPNNCPDNVYEVMISCWRKEENRPTCRELHNTISALYDSFRNMTLAQKI